MSDENKVPPELLPYFLEIAEKLKNDHATVMVGAGFSKNAKKEGSVVKGFPSWNQLGDIFYEKIHGVRPAKVEGGGDRYLNPLKLADEVQAAFDRNVLNNILKNEIPDKEYQPSKLHEDLLKLPWRDVFTTNYDTLLERASGNIVERRFDIVINKEDIIHSTQPRIIKLHGSFPSERPFIITEEDYRKYPKDFAPFVNTVQQSMLENTLCMIGFSGDDPNFLNWIGWVRDNLGKDNSPKIYLIGILNLSGGQRSLLERRNIIPLDLAKCKEVGGNHKEALELFLDFLKNNIKEENKQDWLPVKHNYLNNRMVIRNSPKEFESQISEIIKGCRTTRQSYPNWIIAPESKRSLLNRNTKSLSLYISKLSEVASPLDVNFLYEYNWRIERGLTPIDNALIKHYETIVNCYNPYPDKIDIIGAKNPKENSKLNWNDIKSQWIEIQLSMIRFYREEGFGEKWSLYSEQLYKLVDDFNPDLRARYYYERCLRSLFVLDIAGLIKELPLWKKNEAQPYWEAKRAILLAEFGHLDEAVNILEKSLKTVRNRLNLSSSTGDYLNLSQEAYIMQLLQSVTTSNFNRSNDNSNNSKAFSERWNILKKYDCDPWEELKWFTINLDNNNATQKYEEEKYGFDSISTSVNFGMNNSMVETSYSYLRYIEEIGMPYKLPSFTFGKKPAAKAIECISNYSHNWAFVSCIRSGNEELSDSIYNKAKISTLDIKDINIQINEYLSVLDKSKEEISKGDVSRNYTFSISISKILPEMISRLCIKSSYEIRLSVLDYLLNLYLSDTKDKYRGVKNLVFRLINTFSMKEQYSLIPKLMEFPVLETLDRLIEDEYVDPFIYLSIEKELICDYESISIEKERINELIDLLNEDDKRRIVAATRLVKLFNLNLLKPRQIKRFAKNLWSKTDENGFPSNTNYYYFAFMNIPHSNDIKPDELLRKYINEGEIRIEAESTKDGITLTNGNSDLYKWFNEINGTSNLDVDYTWTKYDIKILIDKCIRWWDLDKKYLDDKDIDTMFGSLRDEFKDRFSYLIDLYSKIFSLNYNLIEEPQRIELLRLFDEFEDKDILYDNALASFYNILPDRQKNILEKLICNVCSKNQDAIFSSLNAAVILLDSKEKDLYKFIKVLSENIRNRSEVGLKDFLDVMRITCDKNKDLLSDDVLSNLELGLKYLLNETVIDINDSPKTVSIKFYNRLSCAKLGCALEKYFKEESLSIPDYIDSWKKICNDENEFCAIQNVW